MRHDHGRTSGFKLGPIHGRRQARQRVMRPLFVITLQPFGADLSDLIEGLEYIGIQHLGAICPIESLDESILIGFSRLDIAQFDLALSTPRRKALRDEFGTIVEPKRLRPSAPHHDLFQHSDHALGRDDVSISMASPSRTPSSNTFKVRNRRPPYRVSLIKSTAHTALGWGTTTRD